MQINMFEIEKVKGIIFDYGGTIDSNGKHWAEVLWEAYQDMEVPVTKEVFREAFVYVERYLAVHPGVQPNHNFFELLKIKTDLQISYLIEQNILDNNDKTSSYSLVISTQCYNFAKQIISKDC